MNKTITLSVTKSAEELLLIAIRKGWSESLGVTVEDFLINTINEQVCIFLFGETEGLMRQQAYQEMEASLQVQITTAKDALKASIVTEIK